MSYAGSSCMYYHSLKSWCFIIFQEVMEQNGELNENTLLKYRQNKWGEGVNSEIFDFKNFENTDTPKDVPYSSLQWITHNFSDHRIVSSEGACSNVYWANLPNGAGGLKIAINSNSHCRYCDWLQRQNQVLPNGTKIN